MDNKVEKKLLVIRNIIRETLLGNAIILLAVYILSKSLPPQNIPDYGIIILTSVTMTGAIKWLFWITTIYIKKIFKKRTWIIIFLLWCVLIQLACHYKINELVNPHECFNNQTAILKKTM
ncbi:TPA: toxin ArtA [Raoultella ornithinolytica]